MTVRKRSATSAVCEGTSAPSGRAFRGTACIVVMTGSRAPQLVLELHGLAAHVIGQRGRDDALDLAGCDPLSGRGLEVDDALGQGVRLGLRAPLLAQLPEGRAAGQRLL